MDLKALWDQFSNERLNWSTFKREINQGLKTMPSVGMALPSSTIRLYRAGGLVPSENLPAWIRESSAGKAIGRWWTPRKDFVDAWYGRAEQSGKPIPRYYMDVPKEIAEKYKVTNIPEIQQFSSDPNNEVFLPLEWLAKAILYK